MTQVVNSESLATIHPDWYGDGVEDGEDLWRLDLMPNLQVQLFAGVDGDVANGTSESYNGKFRVFIERDIRAGENRIDYAGAEWEITEAKAKELLGSSMNVAHVLLSSEIRVAIVFVTRQGQDVIAAFPACAGQDHNDSLPRSRHRTRRIRPPLICMPNSLRSSPHW